MNDQQRNETVRGLRDLADFLEANPDVPTPDWVIAGKRFHAYTEADTPEAYIAAVRALDAETALTGKQVDSVREFGGSVKYTLSINANHICVERETVAKSFVLPDELAPPEPEGELSPADTTAVTW